MADHLLLFAINPVQSYIEQARKTQDLYAGSTILSHLCRTAIEAADIPQEQVIFPDFQHLQGKDQSLPNRFIALVKPQDLERKEFPPELETEKQQLQELGNRIEQKVQTVFGDIAKEISAPFEEEIPKGFFEQIHGYLQLNWLFLERREDDYQDMYPRLERLLQGIKQLRSFAPLSEQGRKCAICGERNVKVYRRGEAEDDLDWLRKHKLFSQDVLIVPKSDKKPDEPIEKRFLQTGEGLCAVCYMKRSAELYFKELSKEKYEANFPSTSNIALFDAIAELPKAIRPKYNAYDAEVVLALKHSSPEKVKKALDVKNIDKEEKIYEALKVNDYPWGPYYALLHFDGDNMGRWLSGEFFAAEQPSKLLHFHQQLAQRLGDFARWAREDLRPPDGRCVYAGGDDFLGFVNLASLFKVLRRQREHFEELVNAPLREEAFLSDNEDEILSFSAGVVVAHNKTPLSEVLGWARRMEAEAKDLDPEYKDAFALAVLKHSGAIRKTVFKWKEGRGAEDLWTSDLLQELIEASVEERFSSKFLLNLEREFRALIDPDQRLLQRYLLEPEARRLIERAYLPDADAGRKRQAVREMTQILMRLHSQSRHSFDNFLQALGIIDFFTRRDDKG